MKKALENLLDAYNLRARLFPAFLMLLPVGLAVAAWVPVDLKTLSTLAGVAAAAGLATLLQQFVRDEGKRKEDRLYQQWGGKPSVRMLSYRHSALNPETLARCHAKLQELAPQLNIPISMEEEAQNPEEAGSAYESCNDLLLEKTRDNKRFAILLEESMNFGFRRNVWGLKPYALVTTGMSLVGCLVRISYLWKDPGEVDPAVVGCAVISTVLLLVWVFLVRPGWVRRAAEVYARSLVLCCQRL